MNEPDAEQAAEQSATPGSTAAERLVQASAKVPDLPKGGCMFLALIPSLLVTAVFAGILALATYLINTR